MKRLTLLKRVSFSAMLLLGTTGMRAEEVKIIDENMQDWKAISAYGDGEQTIRVGSGEGTVSLQQVIVVKSKYPTGIEDAGVCTEGYIQMTTGRTPSSSVKLPVIAGGVSKIELNIITTAAAARTVDVLVEENSSLKTTFTGLSRTGNTYTATIGTTGNTTLIITNVTGGLVCITDIRVYQNRTIGEPSNDASLSSLTYKIGDNTVPVPDFAPNKTIYDVELPFGTTGVPFVTAKPNHNDAVVSITQAPALPGSAKINVKASDNITSKEYQIKFTVAAKPAVFATLPLNASGTTASNSLQILPGFSPVNLGTPASDGGARFESSKAAGADKPMLTLVYDSPGDILSFDIKGSNSGSPLGFEGVDFAVEESSNDITYTLVADLSGKISVSTNYKASEKYSLKPESRFIRWTYRNAVKGNITLNNIVITSQGTTITIPDTGNKIEVFAESRIIYIMTSSKEQIDIFDLTGRKLQSLFGKEGLNSIVLNDEVKFVIIKVGSRMFKLGL